MHPSLPGLSSHDLPHTGRPWPLTTPRAATDARGHEPNVFASVVEGLNTTEPPVLAQPSVRCRLCTCILGAEVDDDAAHVLCGACKRRPEARRLGMGQPGASPPLDVHAAAIPRAPSASAREFTEAERALIRKTHGFMPAQQLLALLNERLACDLGPDATPYSMEQLHAQIGTFTATPASGGHGWAAQRKLIAQARRSGLLAIITEQVIDDFAVVFSLNPKQVLYLRDTLLQQPEDEQ